MRQSVQDLLQKLGHDVVSIIDRAPSLKDEAIMKLAQDEERILIINDLDFGKLIYGFHRSHS